MTTICAEKDQLRNHKNRIQSNIDVIYDQMSGMYDRLENAKLDTPANRRLIKQIHKNIMQLEKNLNI